ncbi:MAG: outer membrane protein assembly factor BamE [Rhodocyclaceae bacterium]
MINQGHTGKAVAACRIARAWVAPVLMAMTLSACFSLYRVDIRQGNQITQEMVSQLRPGMTEDQVRFIMGSPLLQDPFRNNRWDYVYRFSPKGKLEESRRVTLMFADGKLVSIEGDVIAAVTPDAASQPAAKP